MKKYIAISLFAGCALVATPVAAETPLSEGGPTLLTESEMDAIVAGETIELAQFLRTSNVIGYIPGTTIPIYRQIDMSDLPDDAAQSMLGGTGPDTNGTMSVEDAPAHPFAPIYADVTRVGTPSDGQGAVFVTITLETP